MLTAEKTNEATPSMVRNHFFGDLSRNDEDNKECAIMGLIKNQKIVLEEALKEAKLRFADVALEKENWSGRYEREVACKVIEGQIFILSKLQQDFENMLAPSTTT